MNDNDRQKPPIGPIIALAVLIILIVGCVIRFVLFYDWDKTTGNIVYDMEHNIEDGAYKAEQEIDEKQEDIYYPWDDEGMDDIHGAHERAEQEKNGD